MKQKDQEDFTINEITDWEFPSVVTEDGVTNLYRSFDDEIEVDQSETDTIEEDEDEDDDVDIDDPEVKITENLRMDCESKLLVFNELLTKLKNPVSIVDEEVIDILQDIIRKVVKKIIHKEIEQDPQLIMAMIDELRRLLQDKGGMVNIYISEIDYNKVVDDKNQASLSIQSKPDLQPGDIIVKSNFTEIRALLNERIEQLIRVQHD